jgi:K+-sensing histidine kinase KdpD
MDRIKSMAARFTIASELRGVHSTKPFDTVRLSDLLAGAQAGAAEKVATKHINLKLPEDITFACQNSSYVGYVLAGLMDNAVSYSPENDEVVVAAHQDSSGVTISVSDHGSGIPPEEVANLFKPFTKVEGAETFDHEGMGFSLYLDNLILAYVNGTITVESEPRVTTTSTIHLPAPDDGAVIAEPNQTISSTTGSQPTVVGANF